MQETKPAQRMPTPNDLFEIYKLDNGLYQLSSGLTRNTTTINENKYQNLQRLSKEYENNDFFNIQCMTLFGLPIFEIGKSYKKEYLTAFQLLISVKATYINQNTVGSTFIIYTKTSDGKPLYTLMLDKMLWNKEQIFKCVFSNFEHPYNNQ